MLNPRKYKYFNELFAEYIGCKQDEEGNWKFPDGSKLTKTMHFHDRWEWLMMVVERITQTTRLEIVGLEAAFPYEGIESNSEQTLKLNIFNVCYQYIKKIKDEQTTDNSSDCT